MAFKRPLSKLKGSQLKHVAKCIGLTTTGTKSELTGLILQHMREQRALPQPPRIVSVDMGIKNLAICVLEAPHLISAHDARLPSPTTLKILSWKKVDVLNHVVTTSNSGNHKPDSTQFLPTNLSKVALSIAQDLLHSYAPSHILIERQRFRSGGGSAVQEWTLRVNMLESMIWASLQTLRAVHSEIPSLAKGSVKNFPDVLGLSPARVAQFWCAGEGQKGSILDASAFEEGRLSEVPVSSAKGAIQKSDKINLVQSWLSTTDMKDSSAANVQLELNDEAREIADSFNTENKKPRRRNTNVVATSASAQRKLDDLADSLLQGAAWVRWEENRIRLGNLLDLDG